MHKFTLLTASLLFGLACTFAQAEGTNPQAKTPAGAENPAAAQAGAEKSAAEKSAAEKPAFKVPESSLTTAQKIHQATEFAHLQAQVKQALEDAYGKTHPSFSPVIGHDFVKNYSVGRLEDGREAFLFLPDWSLYKPENFPALLEAWEKRATKAQQDYVQAYRNGELSPLDFFNSVDFDDIAQSALYESPVRQLSGLLITPEYTQAFKKFNQGLTSFYGKLNQEPDVFKATQYLANHPDIVRANVAVKAYLDQAIRNAKANGDLLSLADKQKLTEIDKELGKLAQEYQTNANQARNAWAFFIPEAQKDQLKGVPESILRLLKQQAEQRKKQQEARIAKGETIPEYEDKVTGEGYLITGSPATLGQVISHAENRQLREKLYRANAWRASPLDPTKGKYDNTPVAQRIYELNQQKAKLLGYANYAELALVKRAADTPEQVLEFLTEIKETALPAALASFNKIKAYAEKDGIKDFQRWDYGYYKTKFDRDQDKVDAEEFRPYLPADKVLTGFFKVLKTIYGVEFEEVVNANVYEPSVRLFKVYDLLTDAKGKPVLDAAGKQKRQLTAAIYFDLYARETKRQGAWASRVVPRAETTDYVSLPIHLVSGNFTPPVAGEQALWSPNDVNTLFHEVGHALHGVLTKVPVTALSGTNVEWDMVEFPSQFQENFFWTDEVLDLVTAHKDTGKPMPQELRDKLRKYRQSSYDAYGLYRQVNFGVLDMSLYVQGADKLADVHAHNVKVSTEFDAPFWGGESTSYFANTFAHVFTGGYKAGYYSYLWAEILAQDAFGAFTEAKAQTGTVLNPELGRRFRNYVLQAGGVLPGLENFKRFRGRLPDTSALLASYGLEPKAKAEPGEKSAK